MLTIAASARIHRADYGVMHLDGAGTGVHRVRGYRRDIGRPDDSKDAQAEIDALLPELQLA